MGLTVNQTKYKYIRGEFYNKSMKSWLQDKSVVAERFIGTLKNKIHKYMTSALNNMYIDKLADLVNKRNIIYQTTIKMKSG